MARRRSRTTGIFEKRTHPNAARLFTDLAENAWKPQQFFIDFFSAQSFGFTRQCNRRRADEKISDIKMMKERPRGVEENEGKIRTDMRGLVFRV